MTQAKTSLETSFAQFFEQKISDQPVINQIEIPLI